MSQHDHTSPPVRTITLHCSFSRTLFLFCLPHTHYIPQLLIELAMMSDVNRFSIRPQPRRHPPPPPPPPPHPHPPPAGADAALSRSAGFVLGKISVYCLSFLRLVSFSMSVVWRLVLLRPWLAASPFDACSGGNQTTAQSSMISMRTCVFVWNPLLIAVIINSMFPKEAGCLTSSQ
jgi:hypothetical protein